MAWVAPAYTRRQVDRAGETYIADLASREDRELALAVINNWRTSHGFPLNTLQMNLRDVANRYDTDATVAQRIKRLPSIRHKLERFKRMNLSRMQDLGGARAVLSSVENVQRVADYYKTKSRIKHKLVREDAYIDQPKASGYRGTHLVYSYFSDKSTTWNGLKIELQIRSRLQHGWATAVETVGTFTQQALKSSLGAEEWLRFFALMSSALALREGTPCVPDTPEDPDRLIRELRRYAKKLDVIQRLNVYGGALRLTEDESFAALKGHTFLLELNIEARSLTVRAFDNPLIAADAYSAIERAIEGDESKDAVLVAVESLATLRRAYPNYYLDTTAFVESVQEAIQE